MDVYTDVEIHESVGDGREQRRYNLWIFKPLLMKDSVAVLSADEVSAISAHLHKNLFGAAGSFPLSYDAVAWLVFASDVQNLKRVAPMESDVPDGKDWLYQVGVAARACTVILQGRAA